MPTKQDFLADSNWVNRVNTAFATKDLNRHGFVTRDEWLEPVRKAARMVPDSPALLKALEDANVELLDVLGLGQGQQADKEKHLNLVATMLGAGKTEPMMKVVQAWFDFLDTKQKGFLTIDDYTILMKVNGLADPVEAAKAAFRTLEKADENKLTREEMARAHVKFWLFLESKNTATLATGGNTTGDITTLFGQQFK